MSIKKLVYTVASIFLTCNTMEAMQVSYHSFSSNPTPLPIAISADKQEKLLDELARCDRSFQKTPCTQLDIVAEYLTDDYKKIFLGDLEESAKANFEEISSKEDSLSENIENLQEITECIINKCGGLSEAALSLETMYETRGMYSTALLWAYVAHKLGYKQAHDLASRLFLLLRK